MIENKKLTFVRHGHGYHMINKDMNIFDPELTEQGIQETHQNLEQIENKHFDIIFVSPLTRTLQTAQIISEKLKGVKVIVLEMIREGCNKNQVNKRKKISDLKERFPQFDYSEIEENDEDLLHGTEYREKLFDEIECVKKRATSFHQFILNRKENNFLVVSHFGFILNFINSQVLCLSPYYRVSEIPPSKLLSFEFDQEKQYYKHNQNFLVKMHNF